MTQAAIRELTRELSQATDAMMTAEPEEIRLMRTGTLENRAGTYGQYFGTWDIAHGMLRDYSMYTFYPFVRLAEDETIGLKQLAAMIDAIDPPYSNYLRYSGFPELGRRAEALRALVRESRSRKDVVALIRAFTAYTNRLQAWSFHYFPWSLGRHFQYKDLEAPKPVIPDPNGRVRIRSGRPIRITWRPLGITVDAVLASSENPGLCADLEAALPFTVIQDHAVVSGKTMYAWAPLVSTAPVAVRERICDAPAGRIRFSQATGQKIIFQYGAATEDLAIPVLGEVLEKDTHKLTELGPQVWKSTFETKEPIWITVEAA